MRHPRTGDIIRNDFDIGLILDVRDIEDVGRLESGVRILWSDGEVAWASFDYVTLFCELMNGGG